MRSKNWCCKLSWPLIRKDLTRFWPVWAGYFAIWALVLPIPLLNYSVQPGNDYSDVTRLIVNAGEVPAVFMSLLFGGLAAFAVWSHLYRQNSASLYHALPVTRETHFVSHFTAGLLFLLVPNCLIALLTWLSQLGMGVADPTLILQWLALISLENLLFYAIATLAAQFTGSLVAMPAIYGLMNVAFVACESIINEFSAALYYGVTSREYQLLALSPFFFLADHQPGVYLERQQVGAEVITYVHTLREFDPAFFVLLGWYALAALVMLGLALALYRRRSTESAGDVIAVPWLRPVAKYVFTIGCALCLGWIFEEVAFPGATTWLTILLSCAAAGAIGYFAALMLLQKSFRVFRPRAIAGFLPVVVTLALWVLAVDADLFSIERRVPALEDIASVELQMHYDLEFTDPADVLQVQALHRAALKQGQVPPLDVDDRFTLTYRLKDGTEVCRRYEVTLQNDALFTPDAPANLLAAIVNDPDRLADRYLPPEDARLQDGQVYIYHGDLLLNDQHEPNLRREHLEEVLAAMEDDLRNGRTGLWPQSEKYDQVLFRVTLQCQIPLEDDGKAIPETYAEEAAEGYRIRWYDLSFYNSGSATQALLAKLGYLNGR